MIRVLIADDHGLIREGLRRLLSDEPDLKVVGEVEHGSELLAQIALSMPDVLLLDVAMPGPGVLVLMKEVQLAAPRCRIIVLSMFPERQYAARVLRAGGAGYLTKDQPIVQLVAAIRYAHEGGVYVTATVGEILASNLTLPEQDRPLHDRLSERESEVVRLIASGSSTKRIARMLGVSPKTISTYRSRVLVKLNISSTASLIRYALDHRLIE